MNVAKAKPMKKLGARNYALISGGVKTTGSYDPKETLYCFEEQLYVDEIDEIIAFLKWCHETGNGFGSGNYEQVFSQFKNKDK